MHADSRKIDSESMLKLRGISVNEHLPLIESDNEVELRTLDELFQRLIALWSVVGTAMLPSNSFFRDYITSNGLKTWLSEEELCFLLNDNPDTRQTIHFSWQLESLYFLGWCAGLVENIEFPTQESSVESFMHLFPSDEQSCDLLKASMRLRTKSEILDQADLMYRLHWAVRDAQLKGSTVKGVNGGVVQEWHRSVNWMICYEQENNWDLVGTDT